MAESSLPNTGHNTRAVTETEYENLVAPYMPNGVIGAPGDPTVVFGDGSGRQVKVRPSIKALIRGQLYQTDGSGATKTVTANSSGQTRRDLAVLRFTRANLGTQPVTVEIVAGSPGSGPPPPTINASVYEIALATITVSNGASVINGADVTSVAYYVSPPPIVCTSTTRPPHAKGLRIFETDTGKEWISNGSAWTNPNEDSGSLSAVIGPNFAAGVNRWRRVNSIAYGSLAVSRLGSDIAHDSDGQLVATVPAQCKPAGGLVYLVGYQDGGHVVEFTLDTTGQITLLGHFDAAWTAGAAVHIHSVAYPAA